MNLSNTFSWLLVLLTFVISSCSEDDATPVIVASLETQSITDITFTTASGGGDITNDGGAEVTARGICWSTNQSPTTSDNKTSDESGNGVFTSTLSDLQSNTTYYVRAYAVNQAGTAYGNQVIFTTGEYQIPTLTSSDITDITFTTATGGGEITDNGGAEITVRGICWSVGASPDIDDEKTVDGNVDNTYSSALSGLQANTTYYVRAYATNVAGTGYGNQVSFTTDAYGVPTVTTSEVSDIIYGSANGGGEVTDNGGTPVTVRGLCWSTSPNPTILSEHSVDGNGNGDFTSALGSLQLNTTYYVRAYATSEGGTGYGDEVSFQTPFALSSTLPVGHFDFNQRLIDVTGSGNNIALNGALLAADRNGNSLGALYFDGVDDVATGSTAFGNSITSMSVSVWIKTTVGNFSAIKSNQIAMTHANGNNSMAFTMSSGATNSAITPVAKNEWHHIVGTYDGDTKTISIYVDGVLKNSYTEAGTNRSFSGLMSLTYGTFNGSYWGGYLDDLRYYNYALNASQALELYNEQ